MPGVHHGVAKSGQQINNLARPSSSTSSWALLCGVFPEYHDLLSVQKNLESLSFLCNVPIAKCWKLNKLKHCTWQTRLSGVSGPMWPTCFSGLPVNLIHVATCQPFIIDIYPCVWFDHRHILPFAFYTHLVFFLKYLPFVHFLFKFIILYFFYDIFHLYSWYFFIMAGFPLLRQFWV